MIIALGQCDLHILPKIYSSSPNLSTQVMSNHQVWLSSFGSTQQNSQSESVFPIHIISLNTLGQAVAAVCLAPLVNPKATPATCPDVAAQRGWSVRQNVYTNESCSQSRRTLFQAAWALARVIQAENCQADAVAPTLNQPQLECVHFIFSLEYLHDRLGL